MGRRCTGLMFGADMPNDVGWAGDEVDDEPVRVELDKCWPPPDTSAYGDRHMVGFWITRSSIGDEDSVIALDDLLNDNRRAYAKARHRWKRFAAWLAKQGIVVDAPRVYIVPTEVA